MDKRSRIQQIMLKSNCSYDEAVEADMKSNGDLTKAMEFIQNKQNESYVGGSRSGLAVENNVKNEITSYKNGLLVNNKFYDYSENDNIRLKKMLENNEFDAEVLGVNDTKAEVIFNNRESEEYESIEKKKTKTYDENKKHTLSLNSLIDLSCPEKIELAENGDIKFKILTGDRRVTVTMNRTMQISDLYRELSKYTNKKFVLTQNDQIVKQSDDVMSLNRKMFQIREAK